MIKSSACRRTIFDVAKKKKSIIGLEKEVTASGFWDNPRRAAKISQELADAKALVKDWEGFLGEAKDLRDMVDLGEADEKLKQEIGARVDSLEKIIAKEEKTLFLSGPHDKNNVLMTIYAGAGGTESQDWVEMLLRMYLRYAPHRDFKATVLALTAGNEAGLKNVTIEVRGKMAYGILKHENGVHRLVRVSPFSTQGLRHTSFAYVEVMPEIDSLADVEIDSKDLRVDTYRSSGPGGQYVNKTESAVRVTHLPTGIVASSQAGRSQVANKELAMKMLMSRIQHRLEKEHKEKVEELRGEAVPIEWGRQIRSYVLHPYKMVKDHRTGHETAQAESVLEGDLDEFIENALHLK